MQEQPEAEKLETDVTPAPIASAAQDASNQPSEVTAPAPKRNTPSSVTAKPALEPALQPVPAVTSVKYTRRELYEAVWSMSCQKLAAKLGISNVGLAKTCKRLGIPRPSLGYWARVAAGEKVPQTPLPAGQPSQDKTITFDVAANQRRRDEWRATKVDIQDLAVELTLPGEDVALHPLAEKHQRALEKKKPDEGELVHLQVQELFRCDVTPATVTRLCRALHALFVELAACGYKFKSGSEPYSNLGIIKGDDKVTICCTEGQEQIERSPTAEDKRKPSWEWRLKETKPTGRLSFEVHGWGLRGRRTWTESEGKPLQEILGIVVEKVDSVFRGF